MDNKTLTPNEDQKAVLTYAQMHRDGQSIHKGMLMAMQDQKSTSFVQIMRTHELSMRLNQVVMRIHMLKSADLQGQNKARQYRLFLCDVIVSGLMNANCKHHSASIRKLVTAKLDEFEKIHRPDWGTDNPAVWVPKLRSLANRYIATGQSHL